MTEDEEIVELIQDYLNYHRPLPDYTSPGNMAAARSTARERLLNRGEAAVLPLIEALRAAKKAGMFLQAQRLAEVMAETGDPRAALALQMLLPGNLNYMTTEPLRVLIANLAQQGDATAIMALVKLLQDLRFVHSERAIFVAQTLVGMAERNPVQELAAALNYLHCGLIAPAAPLEFAPLRRRLKAALNLTNLPLAAAAPPSSENLPLPADEESHNEGGSEPLGRS